MSDSAPQGILGRVQSVTPISGGGNTVTLTKATLDDAYSVFKLNTTVSGGTTVYADGTQPLGAQPNSRSRMRVPAAAVAGGPGGTFGNGLFSCDSPSAVEQVEVSIDYRNLSFDVAIDVGQPYARVVATSQPKLTVSFSSGASKTCKLNTDAFTTRIPITVAGVPLQLVVHPSLEVKSSAKVTAETTLSPTLTSGLAVLGATATPIGSLTATATAKLDGNVSLEAFLGVTAGVALPGAGEGTAGLTLTAGPRAELALSDSGCTTVGAGVRVDGRVFVATFVNKWEATLATYAPALGGVYDSCSNGGIPPTDTTGSDVYRTTDSLPLFSDGAYGKNIPAQDIASTWRKYILDRSTWASPTYLGDADESLARALDHGRYGVSLTVYHPEPGYPDGTYTRVRVIWTEDTSLRLNWNTDGFVVANSDSGAAHCVDILNRGILFNEGNNPTPAAYAYTPSCAVNISSRARVNGADTSMCDYNTGCVTNFFVTSDQLNLPVGYHGPPIRTTPR